MKNNKKNEIIWISISIVVMLSLFILLCVLLQFNPFLFIAKYIKQIATIAIFIAAAGLVFLAIYLKKRH